VGSATSATGSATRRTGTNAGAAARGESLVSAARIRRQRSKFDLRIKERATDYVESLVERMKADERNMPHSLRSFLGQVRSAVDSIEASL
jgi:hypothetical protein